MAQKWPGFGGGRQASALRHIFGSATFTLAVQALPFFAAVAVGFAAHRSGAGETGAILVGLTAGAFILAVGQIAIATLRSPFLRAAVALIFAAPAAVVGYHAALGLAQIGVPAEGWRQVFALLGAIAVGGHRLGAHGALRPARYQTWRCLRFEISGLLGVGGQGRLGDR